MLIMNHAITTLAEGGVNSTELNWTVSDGSVFLDPDAAGNHEYWVGVWDSKYALPSLDPGFEEVLVTHLAGNVVTVARDVDPKSAHNTTGRTYHLAVLASSRNLSTANGKDVRAFGAKGDGSTNDTAAINLAIQSLQRDGSGTLYFPAGDYRVDSGLNGFTSATRWIGEGWNATSISSVGLASLTSLVNGSGSVSKFHIEGISIYDTTGTGTALDFSAVSDSTVKNCSLRMGTKSSGGTCFQMNSLSQNNTIYDTVFSSGNVGIDLEGQKLSIFGGRFTDEVDCIVGAAGFTGLRLFGVDFTGWNDYAIDLNTGANNQVVLSGCSFVTTADNGANTAIRISSTSVNVGIYNPLFSLASPGTNLSIGAGAEDEVNILVDGEHRSGKTATATTPGTVTDKAPWYDEGGTLVGYAALYDDVT